MRTAAPLLCCFLVAVGNVLYVRGFPSGAPVEACETLAPNVNRHGAFPQVSSVPYEVSLSTLVDSGGSFSYEPGVTYTLTLRSTGQGGPTTFRGFLLQARPFFPGVPDSTPAVGSFTITDGNTQFGSCIPSRGSLTHSNGVDKTTISTQWTAPARGTGAVRIGFAVVQTRTVYWANQRSLVIAERLLVPSVDCGSLPNPTNGMVSQLTTTLGSVAFYFCNVGFDRVGSDRVCQFNGLWSGDAPTCEASGADCGGLPNPTNGGVSHPTTTLGSLATYSCNGGFVPVGPATRVCQASGWSGVAPTCAPQAAITLTAETGAISFDEDAPNFVICFLATAAAPPVIAFSTSVTLTLSSAGASLADLNILTSTTLFFNNPSGNVARACITVDIINDLIEEEDEIFTFSINPPPSFQIVVGVPGATVLTIEDDDITTTVGDDPHFSIVLPSGKLLCYTVQGESDFAFNLISNKKMTMNARFVPDSRRAEVTWIGSMGIIVRDHTYNDTALRFDALDNKVNIGDKIELDAGNIERLTFHNGKLSIYEAPPTTATKHPLIYVDLQDAEIGFTVKFMNEHLDIFWHQNGGKLKDSHGLIGQFFRKGVEIDEVRKILMIPNKEAVPVMRRPVWSFMEREKMDDDQLCWTAMNPGYQGEGLIDGTYYDYLVDDVMTTDYKYQKQQ